MNRKFIDIHSIHFKLLIYFMVFAIAVIAMIGGMEIFLFNNFYGTMKARDTGNLANTIRHAYAKESEADGFNINYFVQRYARANDIYILIMRPNGSELDLVSSNLGTGSYSTITSEYNNELWKLYESISSQADEDNMNIRARSAEVMLESTTSNGKVLAYACYLLRPDSDSDGPEGGMDSGEPKSRYYGGQSFSTYSGKGLVMYILNPLYPTSSTVRILYNILVTIIFFAVVLVLGMALYLSQRISRPIKDITRSAEKLGQGDFDVEFKGGHYSEITELADTLTIAEGEMKKTEMYHKDLIANVSHDIKTPLTMIKSYAEMIRDLSGNDPEKREKHVNIIIEEADRLNVLVNDMLSLSRLQSHKLKLETSSFNMSDAAANVLASYEILKEEEGYDIELNDEGPFMVEADRTKIEQVMNNLMTNAVKYCGEDKKIIVTLRKDGKDAVFMVSDHGQGIKPEELPHVWDRYYQSSTHHVRETSGTGLGLSIVKEILKLHDAKFGVDSEPGKGSTFWFALPIVK
ncbi:MAG: hypothetical protein IKF54_02255 [Eubacterium sp.]|nr:hypothetical protein [Eubacterium sp.]